MFVLDSERMRRLDAAAIEAGVTGRELMEAAGRGAAAILLREPERLEGTTLVLCGKGNNGGDGLVVARELHAAGHGVRALLLCDPDGLVPDAAAMHDRAVRAGVEVLSEPDEPATVLAELLSSYPGRTAVDALLGTGATLPLRGAVADACGALLASGREVVALDLPTGVGADDGAADPCALRARLTISFGFPQWGLLLGDGRRHAGRIERVALPFPREVVDEHTAGADLWYGRMRAAAAWRPRPVDAHKYSLGSVLVVGGSEAMSGAVSLAALGACRGGAGLVECIVPGSARLAVDTTVPEALVHGELAGDEGGLSPDARERILARAGGRDALVLGGGAGPSLSTARLLLELVDEWEGALVLDADGINAMARLQREPRFPARTVLTPHSGELARWLGLDQEALAARRREHIREAAARTGTVLLHKGAPTLVAAPDGRLAAIASGGPALATAGTGDVLAGVVAARLARGDDPFDAACIAAYLHGRAGDLAAGERGDDGVLARDVVEALPYAQRELGGRQP